MEMTRRALVASVIGAVAIGGETAAAAAPANDIDAQFKAFLRQEGHVVDESSFAVLLNDIHSCIEVDYGRSPIPLSYEMITWCRGDPTAKVTYSANYDYLGRSTGQREFINYTTRMWFTRVALDGLSHSEIAEVCDLPYKVRRKLLYGRFVSKAKHSSV